MVCRSRHGRTLPDADPSGGVAALADEQLVEVLGGNGLGGQLEQIEAEMRRALPPISVLTHLEPLGDPAAMADQDLHRSEQP